MSDISRRRERIIELMGKHGRVHVYSLALVLGVSDRTVRRDIQALRDHYIIPYGNNDGVKLVGVRSTVT